MSENLSSEVKSQLNSTQSFRDFQRLEDDKRDVEPSNVEVLLERVLEQLVVLNRNVERLVSRVERGYLG
jgi:hypothetical protein